MTSKRQVTVPKALADRYGIEPGTQIDWQAAGDVIRVIPPPCMTATAGTETRLELFDAATARQRSRQAGRAAQSEKNAARGWSRDELYDPRKPADATGPPPGKD